MYILNHTYLIQKKLNFNKVDKNLNSPLHYWVLQGKENDFSLLDFFLKNIRLISIFQLNFRNIMFDLLKYLMVLFRN